MTDKQQELRALLEETIDEQVDKKVSKIKNENKELIAAVNKLQEDCSFSFIINCCATANCNL